MILSWWLDSFSNKMGENSDVNYSKNHQQMDTQDTGYIITHMGFNKEDKEK